MDLPEVKICSYNEAKNLLRQNRTWPPADAIISLGSPESKPPYGFRFIPYRLRLEFDDVEADDNVVILGGGKPIVYPSIQDIKHIAEFSRFSKTRGDQKIIIHCEQGESRSTAAGFIYFSVLFGPGAEQRAIEAMLDAALSDRVCPNETMITLADQILNRDGRMIKALDKAFPAE